MVKKVLVGDEKYKVLIGKNGIFKDFLPNSLAKNKKINGASYKICSFR